jgi:hypothetical protein
MCGIRAMGPPGCAATSPGLPIRVCTHLIGSGAAGLGELPLQLRLQRPQPTLLHTPVLRRHQRRQVVLELVLMRRAWPSGLLRLLPRQPRRVVQREQRPLLPLERAVLVGSLRAGAGERAR